MWVMHEPKSVLLLFSDTTGVSLDKMDEFV